MDKVLDQIDDKISKMYGTIDSKLKHVSKSFDAKFDNYSSFLTSSQAKIDEQISKLEKDQQEALKEKVTQQEEDQSKDIAGAAAAVEKIQAFESQMRDELKQHDSKLERLS